MIGRIGHVTTDYLPAAGGAEIYVAQLMRALAPLAQEQIVFQWDNSGRDASLRENPSLVLVPRLPGRWRWSRGPNLYAFNWSLRKRPIREKLASCDLLIVHYPFHWPAVAWHPRVIAVSHGVEWNQPPRTWRHRRRRKIARRCDQRVQGLVANDTNFWREMGRDVAPKSGLWRQVAPRRWCLPNAVDTETFSPAIEPALPRNLALWLAGASGHPRPFLLVARNASPNRGRHIAAEAIGRIARDHVELALVIAGQHASPAYREKIDQVAKSWGVADRVCHLGPVPHDQMPGLCRAAEIALVPTLAHEGTSLAALEAMACGTATISSDHGGLADLPAVQVKAGDGALLAKAIEKVWPQREEIGLRQRAVVEEKFNLRRWTEAWRAAVAEVMALPKA